MKKALLSNLPVLPYTTLYVNARVRIGSIAFRSFFHVATKDVLFGLLIFFTILSMPYTLQAQVKIGDNLTSVNANSILELESTTKALLLPRIDQTQIDAMQNVPAGMLVYNSTTNVLNIRTNTGWTTLALAANAASAINPWLTSGNTIYSTDQQVGIGTNQPFSQLANNSGNTMGSDGFGGNPGSFSWAALQQGYVGQIYNSENFPNSNGLAVKVNSTAATALDVSQGPQDGSTAPLLIVKSNGKVGIKNPNPSVELDVNGQINATLFGLGMQYVTGDATLPNNFYGYYKIGCPTGTKLTGGGGGIRDVNDGVDIEVASSGPDPDNPATDWRLLIKNRGSSNRIIRIYAICAKVN